jgi:tetratricopeptide (TPR) repeat protein
MSKDCFKLNSLEETAEYLIKKLEILNESELKDDEQECSALLNLAIIYSKLERINESIDFYEQTLTKLKTTTTIKNEQLLKYYNRCYCGIINSYHSLNNNSKASLYAHSMLDFTLQRLVQYNNGKSVDKCYNYLKKMEMQACSKLAVCYSLNGRQNDSIKLYEREVTLARELNDYIQLNRALSHLAQLYFQMKLYEKSIQLYKDILNRIEINLLDKNKNKDKNDTETETEVENVKSSSSSFKSSLIKDERSIQMIFYTLSNIGLCLEMLNKLDDALQMYNEQLEISNDFCLPPKYRAIALLNLVNFFVNKVNYFIYIQFQ